jgi:hypothetical protein
VRVGRLALVALAVLAGVVVLEAALRLARFGWSREALGRWRPSVPWARLRTLDAGGETTPIPHGEAAWALAPDHPVVTYRLNGLGLRRDGEVAPAPPPGVCRVLAVGDAYTFGYGVPVADAYPAHLERLLDAGGAEVLNAGFPNLNVEQQRRRLQALLPATRPHVVLVTFDWWNVPLAPAPPEPARWTAAWVARHADERLARVAARLGVVDLAVAPFRRALTPGLLPASGLARELEPPLLDPARLGPRWARVEHALAGIAADARQAGARVALVAVPLDLEVEPARRRLYRAGVLPYASDGFVDGAYAASAMPGALRRSARAARLVVVDTVPAFRAAAAAGDDVFLDRDYHVAGAGHALIARQAASWIAAAHACPGR